MLKLLGCILIIITSVIIGIEIKNKSRKRIKGLSLMIEVLSTLKIKISYECSPIPILLNELYNQDKSNNFLKYCLTYLSNDNSLKKSWNNAADIFGKEYFLSKDDISILKDLSHGLGDSDVIGQTTNLSLFIEMLTKNKICAESEYKNNTKVTLSVCVFAGVVFAIILV